MRLGQSHTGLDCSRHDGGVEVPSTWRYEKAAKKTPLHECGATDTNAWSDTSRPPPPPPPPPDAASGVGGSPRASFASTVTAWAAVDAACTAQVRVPLLTAYFPLRRGRTLTCSLSPPCLLPVLLPVLLPCHCCCHVARVLPPCLLPLCCCLCCCPAIVAAMLLPVLIPRHCCCYVAVRSAWQEEQDAAVAVRLRMQLLEAKAMPLAPPGGYNYRLAEVDLRGNTVRWATVSKLHQWRIQHAEREDHQLGSPLVRVLFDERYQVRTTMYYGTVMAASICSKKPFMMMHLEVMSPHRRKE
eukprot:COSAG05_NODE_1144_length_5733_cov_162.189208_4_plen_299_part_00